MSEPRYGSMGSGVRVGGPSEHRRYDEETVRFLGPINAAPQQREDWRGVVHSPQKEGRHMSQAGVPLPTDAVSVLDKRSIDDQPWEPLRGLAGVQHKVLWRSGRMIVGIVRLEPGAEEPGHAHHDAAHHVYMLHGSARIGGQTVEAGDSPSCQPGHARHLRRRRRRMHVVLHLRCR
jgi:hypothetical protein